MKVSGEQLVELPGEMKAANKKHNGEQEETKVADKKNDGKETDGKEGLRDVVEGAERLVRLCRVSDTTSKDAAASLTRIEELLSELLEETRETNELLEETNEAKEEDDEKKQRKRKSAARWQGISAGFHVFNLLAWTIFICTMWSSMGLDNAGIETAAVAPSEVHYLNTTTINNYNYTTINATKTVDEKKVGQDPNHCTHWVWHHLPDDKHHEHKRHEHHEHARKKEDAQKQDGLLLRCGCIKPRSFIDPYKDPDHLKKGADRKGKKCPECGQIHPDGMVHYTVEKHGHIV